MSRIQDLAAQYDERLPPHDEARYARAADKRRQDEVARRQKASRSDQIALAREMVKASDPWRRA